MSGRDTRDWILSDPDLYPNTDRGTDRGWSGAFPERLKRATDAALANQFLNACVAYRRAVMDRGEPAWRGPEWDETCRLEEAMKARGMDPRCSLDIASGGPTRVEP